MTIWRLFVAMVLALLCANYCLSGEWPQPPPGQPIQIKSQVKYDPTLSDPFFKSDEWSYPWWIIRHDDGTIENTAGGPTDESQLPRLKHTARCFTSFQGDHWINFCDARRLDGDKMEIYIHYGDAAYSDNLRIEISNGAFESQYWTYYKRVIIGEAGPTWTTKKQALTLDKQAYRKGDVIKGRIDIEVVDELINPEFPDRPPRPITFRGVFKTIVE
jgi:hypothetical protein